MNKTLSVGCTDWLLLSIRPDSIDDSICWNLHRVWVSHGPRDTWRGSIGAKCCKSCQFVTIFISPGYSLPLYCNPAVTLPIMLCWLIRIDRDPIFDWQISLQLISVRICILHHIGYSVATLCVCTKDVINRTANWHFHILTVKYYSEFANVVYKAGCSFFCRCNNKSSSLSLRHLPGCVGPAPALPSSLSDK